MKKSTSAADCTVDPRTPLSPNVISADGKPWSTAELEVKDARLIFDAVWQKVTQKYGKQGLTFPKEVLWLGGAPGAGKGTNTDFILNERGITTKPIVVSALLDTPEMKAIKDMGGMVGDKEVIEILFETMLKPEYQFGCLVDGVPRTRVQAKVLEMFYTALLGLYNEYMNDEVLGPKFPRPTFRIIQLFVDEKTSVERQLMRGNEGLEHNKKVLESGKGHLVEVRKTDLDPELCRKRYQTFKEQTYDALESLADLFYYQIIDASGTVTEVERKIKDEMMYQSSLELSPLTFTSIRDIPLASEVVLHLRQKLVKSLDNAATEHLELFQKIVDEIQSNIIPVITFHAMGGRAVVHSTSELFRDKHNLSHALDILSERGYSVCTRPAFDLVPSEEAPGFKLVQVTVFDIQWQRGWHRR